MARTARPAPLHSEALDRALALAADAFRHKARKGSRIPYLTHLLAVAALVGDYHGTETEMIAGVLHDFLEDISTATRKALEDQFGLEVARMVAELSDSTQEDLPGGNKPAWRLRKDRYIAHLAKADDGVRLVCAADKLHNALSLLRDLRMHGPEVWGRFNAKPADQIWYYKKVLRTLKKGWKHPILVELGAAVAGLAKAEASHPRKALRLWEQAQQSA